MTPTARPPRLWQRQPGETAADFTAFAAYLRLKGRRSHRAAAAQTGRSLAALRRLSAQFNWPGRVAAFEARLADATQNTVDSIIRATVTASRSSFEQLREAEYQLADRVIQESHRWLKLAADPRRRSVSLTQICRLTELAFYLQRLAVGLPTGDEPRRRPRREDMPGYWTGPSVEEALHKIYGSPALAPAGSVESDALRRARPGSSPPLGTAVPPSNALLSADGERHLPPPPGGAPAIPPDPAVVSLPVAHPAPVAGQSEPVTANSEATASQPSPSRTAGQPPGAGPEYRRRDVWSAWTRIQRRKFQ